MSIKFGYKHVFPRYQETGNWCPRWEKIKLQIFDIATGTSYPSVNNTEANRKTVELGCRWHLGKQYSPGQV